MILNVFKETIQKYNLIQKNDKILVGVSGGADSVALLFLLNTLKEELNLTLHIAHLDHQLRRDSYKDREFVESLAKKLNLDFTSEIINIKKLVQKGSIEEVARNVRFDFFFKTAEKLGFKKIALGHNQDDQVETVLMRLLRGAGLYGLQGILPKRTFQNFIIIRPLIYISRQEIERYLISKKIPFRQDVTNFKNLYFRNKIRNRLIPLLEKEYNPNIRRIIISMVENIGTDYDFLEKEAEKAFNKVKIKYTSSQIKLSLKKLTSCHLAIQRLIMRLAIKKIKKDLQRLSFKHFKELEDLIYNRPFDSIVDLPGGVSCQKKRYFLSFYLN